MHIGRALGCVMGQLEDPIDRGSVSLVCKKWYDVDAFTRKHVTVAFCYSIHASDLTRRKPRAAMYNLLPDDWGGGGKGGYAQRWIDQISFTCLCLCLKALHLRKMIVTDDDLATLVRDPRSHVAVAQTREVLWVIYEGA